MPAKLTLAIEFLTVLKRGLIVTLLPLGSALILLQCQPGSPVPYPATIRPVAFLIERLSGSRMSESLVSPGRNPETYDPSVFELMRFRNCRTLFYVAPSLDGWAAHFPGCRSVALLPGPSANQPSTKATSEEGPDHSLWVSGHRHDRMQPDPHFWTDPHRILEVLPGLQEQLIGMEPESADRIAEEGDVLRRQLEWMEQDASARLKHLKGLRAILIHPTYKSFLEEHGIEVVAVVEPAPGKELSLKEWREIFARRPVDLVIHEVQLPERPSRALAEALNAQVVVLDPMGSSARNLTELLQSQIDTLAGISPHRILQGKP